MLKGCRCLAVFVRTFHARALKLGEALCIVASAVELLPISLGALSNSTMK